MTHPDPKLRELAVAGQKLREALDEAVARTEKMPIGTQATTFSLIAVQAMAAYDKATSGTGRT